MTESELKIEARLTAIEYILSDLCAKWYATLPGITLANVEAAHSDSINRLKKESLPGIDAAISDAFSAELEEAVDAIQRMQRERLAVIFEKFGRK